MTEVITADDTKPDLANWRFDIKTVAGLVDALGGEDRVADELDVLPTTVRNWVLSGEMPPGFHLTLLGLAADIGKTVSPGVFGFSAGCRPSAARGLAKLMIPAIRGGPLNERHKR